MRIIFLGLLLAVSNWVQAQWQWAAQDGFVVGGQVGLSFSVGTHVNRLGLIAKVFAHYNFVQLNAQWQGNYTFLALGSRQRGWEMQAKLGGLLSFGRRDSICNPYLSEVSNQTGRRFAVGYGFNVYRDGFNTNQVGGTVALEAYGVRLVTENDFLSMVPQDRYRTGAVGLYYWYKGTNTQIALQHVSWTGNPYDGRAPWVRNDTTFPGRFGYIDTENAPYGKHSVGILALDVEQILPYYQYAHVGIGIDAEQIRNTMQNKLIHDSPFLPANWGADEEGKNPHIPMICVDGKCYLYKPDQRIRPARFYLQVKGNSPLFY